MAKQSKLIEDAPDEKSPRTMREIEDWIEAAPEEWRDPLRYFTANGLSKRDAMIAAWWSLGKDARKAGKFDTQQKLAAWLGISRARLSTLEGRKHGEPRRDLREWGQLARVRRMNEFGPDVDLALVGQLTEGEASAAHYALYYKITGLLTDETKLHLVGVADGPVEYADVSEAEINAIRQAMAEQAEVGSTPG